VKITEARIRRIIREEIMTWHLGVEPMRRQRGEDSYVDQEQSVHDRHFFDREGRRSVTQSVADAVRSGMSIEDAMSDHGITEMDHDFEEVRSGVIHLLRGNFRTMGEGEEGEEEDLLLDDLTDQRLESEIDVKFGECVRELSGKYGISEEDVADVARRRLSALSDDAPGS